MSYVITALFKGPVAAEAAIQELAMAEIPKSEYHVTVREPKMTQDLRTKHSDGRKGLFIGLAAGAVVGALLGTLIASPLHLPMGSAMLFGLFLGLICGALGGGLYGTGVGTDKIDEMAERFRPGQTVVTAEIESEPGRDAIEKIFRHHGSIPAVNK